MRHALQLRRHRLMLGTWCLAVLIIGGQWRLQSDDAPQTLPLRFSPHIAYSIPVSAAESAVVDLPFDDETKYALIVSSLGDGERRYRVMLTSPSTDVATTGTPHFVLPLQRTVRTPKVPPADSRAIVALGDNDRRAETVKDRSFFIHVAEGELTDRRRYAKVDASLVKTSPRLLIYWDRQLSFDERYQHLVDDVAAQLEDEVMPEISRRLGTVFDSDGDGRFTILFTPWLDRLEGGKTSLRGMVRGTDFRDDVPPPFGHRCDMLYLNPLASPAVSWRDILLHEYTHAVCCSWRMRRGSTGKPLPIEDDWIQEGIAHTLEPLGANQSHRIAEFLASPQEFPLVISDYYHAGLWRNDGCRGATSLFHRWLTEQYGDEWLRAMMTAPSRGTANIEAVCGCQFDELFRAWTVEVMKSTSPMPWNVDRYAPSIELRGTAASFWELSAESSARRQIRITGEPGCRLQVTVIRLPDEKRMADFR